ncbi:Fc.00g037150.m01.CDS01 [Cosmosporella sp. VM-42]
MDSSDKLVSLIFRVFSVLPYGEVATHLDGLRDDPINYIHMHISLFEPPSLGPYGVVHTADSLLHLIRRIDSENPQHGLVRWAVPPANRVRDANPRQVALDALIALQRCHEDNWGLPKLLNASDEHLKLATAAILAYGAASFGYYPPESFPVDLYGSVQDLARLTAMAFRVNPDDLHSICRREGIFHTCRKHCRHCLQVLEASEMAAESRRSETEGRSFGKEKEVFIKKEH